MGQPGRPSRQEASDAVHDLGWRYVLGAVQTWAAAESLTHAVDIAARAVTASGADGGEHLTTYIRQDGVVLTLQSLAAGSVTVRDIELAHRISGAVRTDGEGARAVQRLEIAIDALNIPSIRPFWKAAMAYVDEPEASGAEAALVDPLGLGPAIWFQQMTTPRTQRNRIHLDISVPHDEAPARIRAALDAGGTLVSDADAPSFWVLADAEGNEACVTTWQGRD